MLRNTLLYLRFWCSYIPSGMRLSKIRVCLVLLASAPPWVLFYHAFSVVYNLRNTVSTIAFWIVEYGKYTSAPNGSVFLSCLVLIHLFRRFITFAILCSRL